MRKRLRQVALATGVFLVVGQIIRPARTNPQTDNGRTIQAQLGAASALPGVLNRSCGDCHSNTTEWRWYSKVAPTSWVMAYAVNAGRKAVNFSDWAGYSPDEQQLLLARSCEDVKAGKMPSVYTALRPETRLSPQDIDTICTASRPIATHADNRR